MNVYPSSRFHALVRAGEEEFSFHSSGEADRVNEENPTYFTALHQLASLSEKPLKKLQTVSDASVSPGKKRKRIDFLSSSEKTEEISSLFFLRKTKVICPQGNLYEGYFDQNKLCIYGQVHYIDGSFYKGSFEQGVPHGLGKFVSPNGDVYEGKFDHGMQQGHGTVRFSDGSFYEGMFNKGQASGSGRLNYPNGTFYVGQFSEDHPHGYGKLIYPSKKMYYLGFFKKGCFHGPGRLVYHDGSISKGLFKMGRLISSAERGFL